MNEKFKKKVRHLIIDEKFPNNNGWECEKFQREKIFNGIKDASNDDYIIYSDSDEIPNPNLLKDFSMNHKFGIFMQQFFVYKLNILNHCETPWEGSRICKKKNLKSFTFLRKKILKKNLNKSFWKFYIEKDIKIINNGGWHFNNLYSVETISKKLKVFPHREFNSSEFSNIDIIKKKISNLEDLFDRGHQYKKVEINQSYPEYLIKNLEKYKNYIL